MIFSRRTLSLVLTAVVAFAPIPWLISSSSTSEVAASPGLSALSVELVACEDYACADEVVRKATTPDVALTAIAAAVKARPADFALWCHSLAHDVGHNAAAANPDPLSLFSLRYSCMGGFWHGLLSDAGTRLEPAVLRSRLIPQCSTLVEGSILRFDCYHGLGHAVAQEAVDFASAFSACDMDGIAGQDAINCATGAATVVAQRAAGFSEHGKDDVLPVSDKFSPCFKLSHEKECSERSPLIWYSSSMTTEEALAGCDKATSKTTLAPDVAAEACGFGVARATSGKETKELWPVLQKLCSSFGKYSTGCVKGVLFDIVPILQLKNDEASPCPVLAPSGPLNETCKTYETERRNLEWTGSQLS